MKKTRKVIAALASLAAACTLMMITTGSAHAVPLNLTLMDYPNIVSAFLDVNYDAASDTFSTNGFALELNDDGAIPNESIINGSFVLSAVIDESGALSSGTLTIGGVIPGLGFNSGTLLTGDLTAFGFPMGGGDPFEFLFDVTGGDTAPLYLNRASIAGLILSGTGFGEGFASNFSNTGLGISDTAAVPEPSSLTLLLLGGVGLAALRRRGKNK